MADKKKDLAAMLGDEPQKRPIRRGQPVRLSTEDAPAAETRERTSASSHGSEIAGTQKRTSAGTQGEPKRVNRGYALREDLIKDFKHLAVEEDRKLYEVMEEALEEYLARRKAG
jgi:hypothetical protein